MIRKSLVNEITKRVKEEQKLRKKVSMGNITKKEWEKVQKLDAKNTIFVKKIINQYGWPTFDLIGKRASNYFWLLVQHADKDLKLQEKCLKLLEVEVKNNQAHNINLAYLTDRILVSKGKKQIYGTQFRVIDFKLKPHPIKDIKKVDSLRKKVGLKSLKQATIDINMRNKLHLEALKKKSKSI